MQRTQLKFLFRITLILLAVSFHKKGALPFSLDIQPECLVEPIQRPSSKAPFDIHMRGIDYRVTPLYTYEISGLIRMALS